MFNFQGSEIIIILLLALVVLGPEKLPDAMRKAGKAYAELKKVSSSFQQEFQAAIDEPVREIRETANLLRDSADFTKLQTGERTEKPQSGQMTDAASMNLAPSDPTVTPVDDVPFAPAEPPRPAGSDAFGDLPASRPADPSPDTSGDE